jgi:hypothetical protein
MMACGGVLDDNFPFVIFVGGDIAVHQEIPERVVRIVNIGRGRGCSGGSGHLSSSKT